MSSPGPPGPALGGRTAFLLAAVIAALVLVEVTLLAFLPTTWAVPDLVTVTVLVVAHHRGSVLGGLTGAWAGALLDLVPPAGGPLGAWMLVLGVVGAAHGRIVATRRPGPLLSLALIAVSTAAACVAHAALLWFVGVPVLVPVVAQATLASGLWALLLAPPALLLGSPRRVCRDTGVVRSVPLAVGPQAGSGPTRASEQSHRGVL